MNFNILAEARAELDAAVQYYYDQEEGLEELFLFEIENSFKLIYDFPSRYSRVEGNIRKFIIRKFPFTIIYEIRSDEIVILAVAHQKRKPDYWRERL